MSVMVTGTEIVGGPGPAVCLVNARGPRGGLYEYTVTLDRKGEVTDGVQTSPVYVRYSSAEAVPGEVGEAAMKAFAEDRYG